jgi:hypothetical protein
MNVRNIKRALTLAACGWILDGFLVGCHVPGLTPDTRTPADHAREIMVRCSPFAEERVVPLLSSSAFDLVQPAFSYVKSGPNDREARLRGARLQIKPLPGFSREELARNLECHEARVILGESAAPASDPFVLPENWLDIDVDSTGDGFVVLVRTDEMTAARRVLERARRFAGRGAGQ